MNPTVVAATIATAICFLDLADAGAQDAKFVADNLKFSREFYAKVHFVAVAISPRPFKYDRYPANGPERIQCDDGTYLRQHGQAWTHVDQPMCTGLPIDYAERDRYVMNFAGKNEWGRYGDPVSKETAGKLEGWVKLIDAAIQSQPAAAKLVGKSETEGRAQWIFETSNPNGTLTRFTFRKSVNDKADNVLLHEFSGSLRLDGESELSTATPRPDGHLRTEGAADLFRVGFGYMMNLEGSGQELSERAWEEMQPARK